MAPRSPFALFDNLKYMARKASTKMLSVAVDTNIIGHLPQLSSPHSISSDNADQLETNSQSERLSIEPLEPAEPLEQSSINHSNTITSGTTAFTPWLNSTEAMSHRVVFYVLQDYSRANSLLLELNAKAHGLPTALEAVDLHELAAAAGVPKSTYQTLSQSESSTLIFLNDRNSTHSNTDEHSTRLKRLIAWAEAQQALDILLVPVSVLWGRAPDKQDSWFKLLTTDSWREPSMAKQLFNIGVHGRDTYIQFHDALDLRQMIAEYSESNSVKGTQHLRHLDAAIKLHLSNQLDAYRETVLGPDLADRNNTIKELLNTPAITQAIQEQSEQTEQSIEKLRRTAQGYLLEISNDYSYPFIRFSEHFLSWLWTQLYDGVDVNHFNDVRALAKDYQLVYVPCHRSHIDYLLLSYVIFIKGLMLPLIAAGNNLNIPILGTYLRRNIAFFVRRSFRDNPLYSVVFKEYLHRIISRNMPIEYFIEGGRSRSGRLLPPKTGMLAMTVASHLRQSGKPIVFIPAYIGYERLMEGSSYVKELRGKPKESESLIGLIKASRKIERIFGQVHLNFGEPLYLTDFMQKFGVVPNSLSLNRNDEPLPDEAVKMVNNLGIKVMQAINRAAVVNPVSLLSLVLLSTPKYAIDETSCLIMLKRYQELTTAVPYDKRVVVTQMSPREIINYGIKLKLIERRSHLLGDMVCVAEGQAVLLSYFRNNILHLFILSSLIAALVEHNKRIHRDDVFNVINLLYPFLQGELFLKWRQTTLETIIQAHLQHLIDTGVVLEDHQHFLYAPEPHLQTYNHLKLMASPVLESLERYFMTLVLLSQQGSGHLTKEQVVNLCHLLGQRLAVLYEADSPDFFDKALFRSFIESLIRDKYLEQDEEGILHFDSPIDNIAINAKFVLSRDVMDVLTQIANLSESEIQAVVDSQTTKKTSKLKIRSG